MRKSPLTLSDFANLRRLLAREGGAVYAAERDGKFYVVQDESTLGALLDEDDLVVSSCRRPSNSILHQSAPATCGSVGG
jgi:hypothetical protein